MEDLNRYFDACCRNLPIDETDSFLFSSETTPGPPPEIETHNLVIKVGLHEYGDSVRVLQVWMFAVKETYACLGALTFAALFHGGAEAIKVHMRHADSEIKLLEIDARCLEKRSPGLQVVPTSFRYSPQVPRRHPFSLDLPHELPLIELDECEGREWHLRDRMRGFGSVTGAARMAELFLNISRPAQPESEFILENALGFQSLASDSAELRLLLPGSFGWTDWF